MNNTDKTTMSGESSSRRTIRWWWVCLAPVAILLLSIGFLTIYYTYNRFTGNVPCATFSAIQTGEALTNIQLDELSIIDNEQAKRLEAWAGSKRQCYITQIPSYAFSLLAYPDWSPDRSYFMFRGSLFFEDIEPDWDNTLYLVETESGHASKLGDIEGRFLSWSPDSSLILFYTTEPRPIFMKRYDIKSHQMVDFEIPAYPDPDHILWLNDIRLVTVSYYRRYGVGNKTKWEATLAHIDIDTRQVKILSERLNGEITNLTVSESDQIISFTLDQSTAEATRTKSCRLDMAAWMHTCENPG